MAGAAAAATAAGMTPGTAGKTTGTAGRTWQSPRQGLWLGGAILVGGARYFEVNY